MQPKVCNNVILEIRNHVILEVRNRIIFLVRTASPQRVAKFEKKRSRKSRRSNTSKKNANPQVFAAHLAPPCRTQAPAAKIGIFDLCFYLLFNETQLEKVAKGDLKVMLPFFISSTPVASALII